MSVNKVIIVGLVGNQPDIRTTEGGKEIANFSVATSEKWTEKATGEKKEKTEWSRVVAFGNIAGIVKNYVKKGSKVYLEGSLQTRKWTDKDGVERYTTEIVLQGFGAKIEVLDKKSAEIDEHSKAKGDGFAPETNHVEEEQDDSEIPF